MSHSRHWTHGVTAAALSLVGAALVACGGGAKDSQSTYANDADTGAAAPATQQTLSPNPAMGDSTQGLQDRTGQPQAAGDSGSPAVAPPDTSKGQSKAPAPKRP